MRKSVLLIASVLALFTAAAPALAIQCVPYAREVSGINLKGDAWQWWNAAAGQYDRGNAPKSGAVLVFNRQGSMSHGHVSVVTRVVNSRTILVDHANWAPARTSGRGAVATSVPLMDVSPKNDWSQVRVWYQPSRDFGTRVYRTEGFVYRPQSGTFASKDGMQLAAMGQTTVFHHTPDAVAKKPVAVDQSKVKPVALRSSVPPVTKAVAQDNAAPVHNAKMDKAVSTAKQIFQNRATAGSKPAGIFN